MHRRLTSASETSRRRTPVISLRSRIMLCGERIPTATRTPNSRLRCRSAWRIFIDTPQKRSVLQPRISIDLGKMSNLILPWYISVLSTNVNLSTSGEHCTDLWHNSFHAIISTLLRDILFQESVLADSQPSKRL